ncbi:hypothetical protein CFK37_19680 [Virgibacillus phasianinus]|uniref:Uncharacterized protein n=1 Tax=Virgibacillus phasianinus TaxID=2017483 RepID=A0A220U7V6_9BACI|nr:hypothetical protein CFK37_19680 [Virgibacillus phasianinus]
MTKSQMGFGHLKKIVWNERKHHFSLWLATCVTKEKDVFFIDKKFFKLFSTFMPPNDPLLTIIHNRG